MPITFGASARLDTLTGLRGLLLLWVMFVHLPTEVLPTWAHHAHSTWRFGVDIFLAISGFLVTRSLLQDETSPTGEVVKSFLVRRAARIFPAYYVMLSVVVLLAFASRSGLWTQLVHLASTAPSFLLFYANYLIPGREIPHSLAITWSLSFQEQFYTGLAILFVVLGRRRLVWALAAASIASILMRFYMVYGPWAGLSRAWHYQSWLHLNFDAIGWGCLFWFWHKPMLRFFSVSRWVGEARAAILAVIGAVIVIPGWIGGDLAYVVCTVFKAPALAALVVMVAAGNPARQLWARVLGGQVFQTLGNASYEIYLVHVITYGLVAKFGLARSTHHIPVLYLASITLGLLFCRGFSLAVQNFILGKGKKPVGEKRRPERARTEVAVAESMARAG